jgi:hypothetical protein
LTQRSVGELQQLVQSLNPAVVAAFLPYYRELLEREIRPGPAVLRQLALLAARSPESSSLLLSLLPPAARSGRRAEPGGRAGLNTPARQRIAELAGGGDAPSGAELQELTQLLYGSPELALLEARQEAELSDLANTGVDDSEEAEELLALLVAQRARAALGQGPDELLLPLDIDGRAVALELEHSLLGQEYYQQQHYLRLRLETPEQGPVEIHLRTHGTGLTVQMLAQDEDTLAAYQDDLPLLEEELRSGEPGYA